MRFEEEIPVTSLTRGVRYDPDSPRSEQEGQPWMVQRIWATIDPIFFVNDTGLACNTPGTAPPSYIPINAGDDLTAVYYYWLHPVGPMSVWLASCGEQSCEDVDVNELDFFKIWEAGLLEGNVPEELCALDLDRLDVSNNVGLKGKLGPKCKALVASKVLNIDGTGLEE